MNEPTEIQKRIEDLVTNGVGVFDCPFNERKFLFEFIKTDEKLQQYLEIFERYDGNLALALDSLLHILQVGNRLDFILDNRNITSPYGVSFINPYDTKKGNDELLDKFRSTKPLLSASSYL